MSSAGAPSSQAEDPQSIWSYWAEWEEERCYWDAYCRSAAAGTEHTEITFQLMHAGSSFSMLTLLDDSGLDYKDLKTELFW